ncbi:hypothetical protein PUP68_04285 [Pseudomonas chlororaphis]|uniref:hypothetical protein n=1 Tax=Pseudomonas chlororaphis TaxID=587753 RepID=UPI0006A5784E|nr:hypothetical protein [Pseudomonas chlororaphis]WDG80614.1 hypothetical protein PUP77_07955 [Pseudomonas chlororaphis]WDG86332.1 hypothetical protein PUP68_04285 [Pseudomonas chlororaphis]WDG92653.1 hypothetical protein PUP49_04300 [Pseudomonas chlororaphis]
MLTPIDDRAAASLVAAPRRKMKMFANSHIETGLATIEATTLRGATVDAPCRVAGLAEGTTITCAPRLAWHADSLHRGASLDASTPR